MVAITVILAAVIGAFVLEIGDQQETAPSTSFDTDQQTTLIKDGGAAANGCFGGSPNDANCLNVTEVTIAHAGGDVLDVTQTDASVDGNTSVWGLTNRERAFDGTKDMTVGPKPDFRPTLGSNEQVSIGSGESMTVMYHGGAFGNGVGFPADPPADQHVTTTMPGGVYFAQIGKDRNAGWRDDNIWLAQTWTSSAHIPEQAFLQTDDEVRVVWTAESGGKTQTLFQYTVQ
jgi:hypothetical protein